MPKKARLTSTFKQRLNGNSDALKIADQYHKIYSIQDILTAGIFALHALSPAEREKVFAKATGAKTTVLLDVDDLREKINSDKRLTKTRRQVLVSYLAQLLGPPSDSEAALSEKNAKSG